MVLWLSMKIFFFFFEVYSRLFQVKYHEVYNLFQQKITDGANIVKYESCLSLGDMNEALNNFTL